MLSQDFDRYDKQDGPAQTSSGTVAGRRRVASYRSDLEKSRFQHMPSLDELEGGKLVGAVVPMSEKAQNQMRDSIEVIDYLLNQDQVTWS